MWKYVLAGMLVVAVILGGVVMLGYTGVQWGVGQRFLAMLFTASVFSYVVSLSQWKPDQKLSGTLVQAVSAFVLGGTFMMLVYSDNWLPAAEFFLSLFIFLVMMAAVVFLTWGTKIDAWWHAPLKK